MLLRLGLPIILVKTRWGDNAKIWSSLSGISRWLVICLERVGAARLNGVLGRGKVRYSREEVAKDKIQVVGTGVLSGMGQSGEWSWSSGMVLLMTDKLRFFHLVRSLLVN